MRKVEALPTRDCEAGYGPGYIDIKVIFQFRVIALPFKTQIHTKIFLTKLTFGYQHNPPTANRHGYRKPIDLLEQLPSYAERYR